MRSNIQLKFFYLNVRRDGPQPSIFVRSFSQITTIFHAEEATQTSFLCVETLAPEGTPALQRLAWPNLERKIRSLGLIPSNLQGNYYFTQGGGKKREG